MNRVAALSFLVTSPRLACALGFVTHLLWLLRWLPQASSEAFQIFLSRHENSLESAKKEVDKVFKNTSSNEILMKYSVRLCGTTFGVMLNHCFSCARTSFR